ncbi:dienelactone hydrolase endo-1,3,1,4-beta-D-glucanase [Ramaria rubella]|nr:dienelactone hydrolase endo-1,3,1,4-beta-D-glucanase [Ramaria rubella]
MSVICEQCVQGNLLNGTPEGSFEGPAYYHPASTPSKRAIIISTDIFGLKLINSKLIADQYSKRLNCDVWVPDLFEGYGKPPLKESQLAPLLNDVPGTPVPFLSFLKFIWTVITNLPGLIRNRPTVVDNRMTTFLKRIKEEKKYEKIGAIGFCFGGAQVVRLASADLFDSAIVAHPGPTTKAQVEAMKIPTSWICAEEDRAFGPKRRAETEAIFKRKQEANSSLKYEFRDYKGTVHGFGCRPNLNNPDIKKAFESAFEQAVTWFDNTLPVS